MKEIPHSSPKAGKQTINIAGEEISSILDITESAAIVREKFNLLYNYCIQQLWLTNEHPQLKDEYKDTMNHYLRNGAYYFFDFHEADRSEKCKKNYSLFRSVITHIGEMDQRQKLEFLKRIKHYHDTDSTVPTPNPIVVMDNIISSIE